MNTTNHHNGFLRELHDLRDKDRQVRAASLVTDALERMAEEQESSRVLDVFEQTRGALAKMYEHSLFRDRDLVILSNILSEEMKNKGKELKIAPSRAAELPVIKWDEEEKMNLNQLEDSSLVQESTRILAEAIVFLERFAQANEQIGKIYQMAEKRLEQIYENSPRKENDLPRLLIILGKRVLKAFSQKS